MAQTASDVTSLSPWTRRIVAGEASVSDVPLVAVVSILFLFHIIGTYTLLTESVGSVLWFVGVGYLVYLALKVRTSPHEIAIVYGGFGVISIVIVDQSLLGPIGGVGAGTLVLSTWIPALFAALWWWIWHLPCSTDVH